MNKYELLGVVGEGAYGIVLKCRNKESGETVAIKKFKDSEESEESVKKTMTREVKILRMLRHPNVVSLREAFRRKGKLYLVFEFVSKNLLQVLELSKNGVGDHDVRRYVLQLSLAIDCCHSLNIIHRDIKPENLLIDTREKKLKLCDFGFARVAHDKGLDQQLSEYVATRWYRAPELLLGSTCYDNSVDIFAMGCIMGELTDGEPLFPGESEIDQLYIIQLMLGPLTPQQNDLFLRNPRFIGLKFPDMSKPETTLQAKYLGKLNKAAMLFIKSLLHVNPKHRATSKECLQHAYFDDIRHEYCDSTSTAGGGAFQSDQKNPTPTTKTLKNHRPVASHQEAKHQQETTTTAAAPTKLQQTKKNCHEAAALAEGKTSRHDEVPILSTFGRVDSRESSQSSARMPLDKPDLRLSPNRDDHATPTPPSFLPPDRFGRFGKHSRNKPAGNGILSHAAEAKEVDSTGYLQGGGGIAEEKTGHPVVKLREAKRPHKQTRKDKPKDKSNRKKLLRPPNDDPMTSRPSSNLTKMPFNAPSDLTSTKFGKSRSNNVEEDLMSATYKSRPGLRGDSRPNTNLLATLQPVSQQQQQADELLYAESKDPPPPSFEFGSKPTPMDMSSSARCGKSVQPLAAHGKRKKMRREQPPLVKPDSYKIDSGLQEMQREHDRELQRELEQRREDEIRELREFANKLPSKLQNKLNDGGVLGTGGFVDAFSRTERRLTTNRPLIVGGAELAEGARNDRIIIQNHNHQQQPPSSSDFPSFRQ